MTVDFYLHATPDRILVRAAQGKFTLDIPNSHLYDIKTLAPLGFGVTEEEEACRDLKDPKDRETFDIAHLFTPDTISTSLQQAFLEYCITLASEQAHPPLLKDVPWIFIDRFDFDLWIEGYDQFPESVRAEFEYGMQDAVFKVNKLKLNGRPKEIVYWKRFLDHFLRFSLRLIPLALILTGIFNLVLGNLWLGAALLGLAIFILLVGHAFWLFVMRPLVPGEYLRYQAVDLGASPIFHWLFR